MWCFTNWKLVPWGAEIIPKATGRGEGCADSSWLAQTERTAFSFSPCWFLK